MAEEFKRHNAHGDTQLVSSRTGVECCRFVSKYWGPSHSILPPLLFENVTLGDIDLFNKYMLNTNCTRHCSGHWAKTVNKPDTAPALLLLVWGGGGEGKRDHGHRHGIKIMSYSGML